MSSRFRRFFDLLGDPIRGWARIALACLAIPLALSLTQPLWNIHMVAPQYPDGLDLQIYPYTVEGDVQEINTLNHYIGMRHIDRVEFSDLDWIPFAIGALILLSLRVAAIGDVRSLVDLTVLLVYFSIFSLGRFAYKLYVFGHDLDPRAPFHMDPFMPALLGKQQIANFTTWSYPMWGSALLGIFAAGVVTLALWHLIAPWRASIPARASS